MPRRGENIYRRKDGRWEGRYIKDKIGNKAKYGYVYARSYQEVKEKLHLVKSSVHKDIHPKDDILFSELCSRWLAGQGVNSKAATVQRYSSMLSNQILPFFGKVCTSEISTDSLISFVSYLTDKCALAEKTASNTLCAVKSILRYGEKMNVLHSCVLSAVSVKSKPKEMRVLSCDEYKKLTAYFIYEKSAFSVGMLTALLTGLRIGELCALKYNDIDIPNKRISINKTMQRLKKEDGSGTYISIDTPKSRASERVIPIPDFLCEIIQAKHYSDDDYLLTGTAKYIEPRTLQYRYKSIMKKLGITGTTFHTLRHSFATRCVEVGFDIKSLSEILGHSSVNITLNRYVHSSFELKAENMKKLSVFLDYSPSNL